jgi:sugar phosphate isomerase/epimerase
MTDQPNFTNASLSTMWSIGNYPDLSVFFVVARQLGFGKIELNHQVSSHMLSQVDFDHYEFSSIHEPCPSEIPTKELLERNWLISALDEDARLAAVDAVKKSIDLAYHLSAPVVVIHCGTIPSTMNFESKLRSLYNTGQSTTREYRQIKTQFELSRKALATPHMQSVKKSLDELIAYSAQFGIKLGLENRYHYLDIPSPDEMEELLSPAGAGLLGFIYDVGHAQALDRLGFYPHKEWLERFASKMVGCHLHDVIGLADHLAPGLGEIDFASIANFLPESAFRTCELLPGNTLAQVKEGLNVLIKAGCIRNLM